MRCFPALVALAVSVVPCPSVSAASGTWNVDLAGNWSNTANWLDGVEATGQDSTAYFTYPITAARTVTLDSSRTIGNLYIDGSSGPAPTFSLARSGSAVLTMSVGAGMPSIYFGDVASTISASLAGSQGIAFSGKTDWYNYITGANTYTGGTVINSGIVLFNNTGAVPTSGTILVNSAGAVGGGAYSNTNWLTNGKINSSSTGALAIALNGVADTSTLDFTNVPKLSLFSGGIYSGAITPGSNGYFFGGAAPTSTTVIASNLTAATGVTINGNTKLTGSNSYSGTTTINRGVLTFNTASAFPNTAVIINAGGALATTDTTPYTTVMDWLNGGYINAASTGTININSSTPSEEINLTGYDNLYLGSNTLFNGTLTPGSNGYLIGGPSGATLNMVLTGDHTLTIGTTANNNGTVTLYRTHAAGADTPTVTSYTGDTLVNAGTTVGFNGGTFAYGVGKGNVTVNGTVLFGTNQGDTDFGDRYNMKVNGLSGSGLIQNNYATHLRTFSVGDNNADGFTFSGVIANGLAPAVNLKKVGTGTQTLSGANTYTGITYANGGTLLLDMNAGGSLASASSLSFGGGNLQIKAASTGSSQSFSGGLALVGYGAAGGVTTPGGGKLTLDPNGGGLTLTIGNAWSREVGSSLLIDYSSANAGARSLSTTGATSTYTTTNGLYQHILVKDSAGVGGFATLDGSNHVVRYDDAALATTLAADSDSATTNFTTRNSGSSLTWTNGGALANRSVGALIVDATNTAQTIDMGAEENVLTSGAILFKGGNDATLTGGKLGADGSEVVIHQMGAGTFTVGSLIAGTDTRVTVSGTGRTVLSMAETPHTGITALNGSGVTALSVAANTTSTMTGLVVGDGRLAKAGAGNLVMNQTSRNTYLGGTIIEEGFVNFYNNTQPTNGKIRIESKGAIAGLGTVGLGATAWLTSGLIDTASTGFVVSNAGTADIDFTAYPDLYLSCYNATTFSGNITPGSSGYRFGGLTYLKNSGTQCYQTTIESNLYGLCGLTTNGDVTLAGSNAYHGPTTINGGTLTFNTLSGMPTDTTITINAGGGLAVTGPYSTVTGWLGSGKINTASAGAMVITASSSENINLTSHPNLYLSAADDSYVYSGTLTPGSNGYLLGGMARNLEMGSYAGLGGAHALTVYAPGGGAVWLVYANSYTGDTTIKEGTLQIISGETNVMPHGPGTGNLIIQSAGIFDIGLSNTTINGLSGSGKVLTSLGFGEAYTLTLGDNNANGNFSGKVTNVNYGTLALTKIGTGKQVLSGTADYAGVTTVQAGTLELGTLAQTPVLAGAGADIQGGKLVLDYTGTSAVDAAMMAACYNNGNWDVGQFKSSTAVANSMTLGWADDAAGKVTIMATYAGDFNLDGSVNLGDLDIWKANVGGTAGVCWATGDANYDGAVNLGDLDLWKAYVGSVVSAGSLASVPEPGALALLATGLLGLLAYAWRKRK